MATTVRTQMEQIDELLARTTGRLIFHKMKLPNADFSGKELRNADFRGASIPGANFKDCDLTYANFEGANCFGASFENANLHRANFKDANLSCSNMRAKDLFGVTITLECKSFRGIKILPGWWYGWLFYPLLMEPISKEAEEGLISYMGSDRYQVLRSQYMNRNM